MIFLARQNKKFIIILGFDKILSLKNGKILLKKHANKT